MSSPTHTIMRVTATFGSRFELCEPHQPPEHAVPARARGKRLRPVTGDLVEAVNLTGESDWQIESILPRSSELDRTDTRGRREILAANVSMMVVVVSAQPEPDWFVADRYLAAAELMPARAIIVWNKCDIESPPDTLSEYQGIGYPVVETDALSGSGVDRLRTLMQDQLSIFVGQSGVGKSTLINALSGDTLQRTGSISSANREGRHTTVAAQLLTLGDHISVIDSPGVRDYAPGLVDADRIAVGFREIFEMAEQCRFANCRHRAEPDCAVKAAAESGQISERRYKSYLRLAQINRQLSKNRR